MFFRPIVPYGNFHFPPLILVGLDSCAVSPLNMETLIPLFCSG